MSRVYHTAHKRAKFCNIVRNLVTELVLCEHVKVTKSRKNQVKNTFDKLVTLAKNNTLHDYRQIFQIIRKNVKDDKNVYVLAKLKNLAIKYKDRKGGYLKVYNLGSRRGDLANVYYLTLV